MHTFYGKFLHCKSSLVQFIHEYNNVLENKEQKELKDDAADSKGVIPCESSTTIKRQFQREYTSSMFRDIQLELRKKKTDCVVWSNKYQGDSIFVKVDEQKIVSEKTVYYTYRTDFDPLTHEVRCECNMFESTDILCYHTLVVLSYYRVDRVLSCYSVLCKHTYIKSSHDVAWSDKSHNLFRGLCVEFHNVFEEFVTYDEEDTKSKLTDYRASMHSINVAAIQNSMPIQSAGGVDVVDLRTDNDYDASGKKGFDNVTGWNASDSGKFISLLNSFGHS
ncbi:hypothetical protein Ahy_A06g029798 [Arachis hypogaea]|uniref:Protein FAR1-RELATED SEQUENCE n=1 Tax=Arachis hypogaea TaxID=3818 RepID=A0A445CUB5_ARAHY|nr:hypothetical protein Ahy_A06g029798 [Arachis hypogaea]